MLQAIESTSDNVHQLEDVVDLEPSYLSLPSTTDNDDEDDLFEDFDFDLDEPFDLDGELED